MTISDDTTAVTATPDDSSCQRTRFLAVQTLTGEVQRSSLGMPYEAQLLLHCKKSVTIFCNYKRRIHEFRINIGQLHLIFCNLQKYLRKTIKRKQHYRKYRCQKEELEHDGSYKYIGICNLGSTQNYIRWVTDSLKLEDTSGMRDETPAVDGNLIAAVNCIHC
ncbi:Hypothetical predicted protein [Octopus vulgaris]|uniref:Uncharacterized protein n=1 Tax=Octopus vulgaris TaxID=6645 RepID=A0AA36F099_OCTVU|nr:Hypothetical predicted protein [Octopus vulgaris]